jgi:acetyltransferase-like isoleucine patch superfamily enzyme
MQAPAPLQVPPGFRPPGRAEILAGLLREAFGGLGYLLLRIAADWVLFPDGPLFWKVRGRLFVWLFGWGRGVGVGRHVRFVDVRSIRVGPYTRIASHATIMGPAEIGAHCWIGEKDVIYPRTTLGDNVSLGPLVYVVTQWHALGPPSQRTGPLDYKPVRIGSGASVNAGALILAGCHVGEGAVVAGGAKVTRSVPPNVVVAGNPAAIVHRLEA